VVIYEAFVEGKLEAPRHMARTVHDHYFEPKYEEFQSRTIWSLSNAFTSAFQELEPIPQFKVTAKLGEFLEARFLQPELLCRAHHCVPHLPSLCGCQIRQPAQVDPSMLSSIEELRVMRRSSFNAQGPYRVDRGRTLRRNDA
jgi:hypothetical protein